MDDTRFSREWSHFTEVASSLYCDRVYLSHEWSRTDGCASFSLLWSYVSSSSSRFVDDVCHPGMGDKPASFSVEEVNPNRVAALISTRDAKRVVVDCEGTMHTNLPLVLGPRRFT